MNLEQVSGVRTSTILFCMYCEKNILARAGLFSYWLENAQLFADLLRFFVVTCRPSIFPIFEDFAGYLKFSQHAAVQS
jgi:hypothetical protein